MVLASLTTQQRQEAMARFVLLRPALEDGVPLVQVARAQAIPYRTAWRWVRQYHKAGLAGLVRQPRSDRGERQSPDTLVRLIEGLALRRPAPSVASVHRQAARVAAEQGWPMPSYKRVYDIVRQLDPGLVTLAHEGTKGCVKSQRRSGAMKSNSPQGARFRAAEVHRRPDNLPDLGLTSPL
jgi:putative transposase